MVNSSWSSLAVATPASLSIKIRLLVPPKYEHFILIALAMIEKSSAVPAGKPRNNIAGLRQKFSCMKSMHFSASSAREEWLLFLTRTPSGNESLGSARNSGKPPPEESGRNCLSLSLDLNFVTRSSLGIGLKLLAVVELRVRIGLLSGPDESLQKVAT